MNISKNKRNDKRYQIRVSGFSLNFAEQMTVHKRIQDLLEKIPLDSRVELRLEKKDFYSAHILVTGSSFGCNLKSECASVDSLIKKIFSCISDEVHTWERSPKYCDQFAPYFGGYPSYYKEVTV